MRGLVGLNDLHRSDLAPEASNPARVRAPSTLPGGPVAYGAARVAADELAEEVSVSVFHDFEDARSEWRAYEEEGMGYAFQSFDWLKTWFQHIGSRQGIRPCLVAVRHPSAGRLMFLPMGLENRLGSRCLTWLGGRNTDYLGPLLGEGWASLDGEMDLPALWRRIRSSIPPFDCLHLEKQPANIEGWPNPFLALGADPGLERAFYSVLDRPWKEYYKKARSGRSRSTDRRKLRKLEDQGALQFRMDVRGGAEVERVMGRLAELKSRHLRHMGVRDLFAIPGCLDFYTSLAMTEPQHTRSILSSLELDGEVIAAHWGVVRGKRLSWLLTAYDDAYGAFSPGVHLMHALMEWCSENGVNVFDFSLGEEPYKLDWADGILELSDHLSVTGPRGYPYYFFARSLRLARVVLRRVPALQRAKTRFRKILRG